MGLLVGLIVQPAPEFRVNLRGVNLIVLPFEAEVAVLSLPQTEDHLQGLLPRSRTSSIEWYSTPYRRKSVGSDLTPIPQ